MLFTDIPRTNRYQVSANFFLDEYINPAFYKRWGTTSVHWIRPEVIKTDQFLRSRFGILTVNNWWIYDTNDPNDPNLFTLSGLRPFDSGIGASYSFHIFGCASDKKFKTITAEEVREDIRKYWDSLYRPLGLTCIEKGVSWVHSDCRNTGLTRLMEVSV